MNVSLNLIAGVAQTLFIMKLTRNKAFKSRTLSWVSEILRRWGRVTRDVWRFVVQCMFSRWWSPILILIIGYLIAFNLIMAFNPNLKFLCLLGMCSD